MNKMPQIDEANRRKPLCLDAASGRFIAYDDIVSGKAKVIPPATLTPEQQAKLVAERHRTGPDYTVADMNGRTLTRDMVVAEIENGTEFGQMTVGAEVSYLTDLLAEMDKALPQRRARQRR